MSGGFGLPKIDFSPLAQLGLLAGEEAQKRRTAGAVNSALQSGDYAGAAGALFEAGDTSGGLGLLKLGETARQNKLTEQSSSAFQALIGGGGGGSDFSILTKPAGPDAARAVPSFADTSSPSSGYIAGLFKRESGNNPTAQASTSSARGLGQFTTGTWNGLAQSRPDLGLTPVSGGRDGRTDPDQMVRATQALTAQNEERLRRVGLPVNDVTRYGLHFLGEGGGLRFLKRAEQNPDAPAASYVSPEQVRANRNVFFNRDGSAKTARQVMDDWGRSFGGGSAVAQAPRRAPVAYAENEDQTQALEARMGMTTPRRVASADPSDMPAEGAQDAAFYIPGTEPGVRAPLTAHGGVAVGRGMSLPGDAPLPGMGGAGGRGMSMPGGDPGPASPPVQVAQAGGLDLSQSEGLPPALARLPTQQRIARLSQIVSLPGLPDNQRQVAMMFLKQTIDQTSIPDSAKEYVWARTTGQTQARTLTEYNREKAAPTKLSPGESIYDQNTGQIRLTAPGGRGERDEGDKIREQAQARAETAQQLGLAPGSPAYQSFVLTGKMPREDQQPLSASDKKAILEADEAVNSAENVIGNLRQAKELSAKAYSGPLANVRGYGASFLGSEAGQATLELDNLVTSNALAQLKSIFGAAPTEGERKILLDIQGSSSLPHALRVKIYDRAEKLAERRLEMNRQRASEMRGQTYYRPDGGPASSRALPAPSSANRPGAPTAEGRFRELIGSGLSKEQAYGRLQSEGY